MAVDPEFERFCRAQIQRICARLNPPRGRSHATGPRKPTLSELDARLRRKQTEKASAPTEAQLLISK